MEARQDATTNQAGQEDTSMISLTDEGQDSKMSTSDHEQDYQDDSGHEDSEMGDEKHGSCGDGGSSEEEEDPEEEDDYNGFSSWPWLKVYYPEEKKGNKAIAGGRAFLIDREPIRDDFFTEMEAPVQELSDLAYDLFDRFSRLKREFIEHPVKRGSGVWGEELNRGKLLDFERISVDKKFRRQGIGRKIVTELWAKVRAETDAEIKSKDTLAQMFTVLTAGDQECKFALAWGTPLNSDEAEKEAEGLSEEAQEELHQARQSEVIAFWRSLGFRRIGSSNWFALAADPTHPAHSLPAASDYDPPVKIKTQLPIHAALLRAAWFRPDNHFLFSDDDGLQTHRDKLLLAILEAHQASYTASHPSWKAVDGRHNTVLHQIVLFPESLKWFFAHNLDRDLLGIRNHDGETAAEKYHLALENRRIQKPYKLMIVHASDYFRGYGAESARNLMRLRGLSNLSPAEFDRLSYGCSCGECTSFMSPRVMHAVHVQADILGDILGEGDMLTETPTEWVEWHQNLFEHVDPGIVQNFKTNKSLRIGFASLFHHVATCLSAKKLPTTANVLAVLEGASEWPPYTKNFFQRGGKVSSAVLTCFEHAIGEDLYLGNQQHYLTFKPEIEELPTCRNDHELVMAMRNYKALECGEHALEGYPLEPKGKSCREGEDEGSFLMRLLRGP